MWAAIWKAADEALKAKLIEVLLKARSEAARAGEHVERHGPAEIRKALNSFRAKTAIGLDLWGLREMATLNDEALGGLAGIVATMNQQAAPPLQVLGQFMNLLGKKQEGTDVSARWHPCTG